ncbi:MAG: Methanol dehydrogenase regulator [Myxococcales bacterium]|nr:Methanol dehydrogenase regulator [Myxococcales bacterium]
MATQTIERSTLQEVATLAADVRTEVQKAFYGGAESIELILTTLMARGHVLLEGVPGIAKTTLVKAFATALGCSFRRVQFTPDLLPSDITGTFVLQAGTFALREGPIFAQVILADEINRAPAKTQSALLEAMQERQVTIEGQTKALELPFFVLATQNPIEHEGTYPLPEAQVDRFLAKLKMGYPAASDEKEMLRRYSATADAARETRRVLEPATILRLQELADSVHVEDELLDYVIALAQFTRTHRRVALGASPRAALQLVHAAKARALLGGRDFVLPDDVKHLGPAVLSHRVMLSADAELEGMGADAIVREALDRVPYRGRPRA